MTDLGPSWTQMFIGIGGFSAITGIVTAISGHRLGKAQISKTDAETKQIEDRRGADYETALNQRTLAAIDAQDKHIQHLTQMIERQSTQIDALQGEVRRLQDILRERDDTCGDCEHWPPSKLLDGRHLPAGE